MARLIRTAAADKVLLPTAIDHSTTAWKNLKKTRVWQATEVCLLSRLLSYPHGWAPKNQFQCLVWSTSRFNSRSTQEPIGGCFRTSFVWRLHACRNTGSGQSASGCWALCSPWPRAYNIRVCARMTSWISVTWCIQCKTAWVTMQVAAIATPVSIGQPHVTIVTYPYSIVMYPCSRMFLVSDLSETHVKTLRKHS